MSPGPEPHDSFQRTRVALGVLYALFPFVVLAVALMDRRPSLYSVKATIAVLYIGLVAPFRSFSGFGRALTAGSHSSVAGESRR